MTPKTPPQKKPQPVPPQPAVEPDWKPRPMRAASGAVPASHWVDIINAVKTPLGFFVLVFLISQLLVVTIIFRGNPTDGLKQIVIFGTLVLMTGALGVISILVIRNPEILNPRRVRTFRPSDDKKLTDKEVYKRVKEGEGVLDAGVGKAKLDLWYRQARDCLHQASYYSVPTYYLDNKLRVVDWNVAFEILFKGLVKEIQGQHVNWFIARLANYNQVFDHAKQFTRDVQEHGAIPYVDMERLVYDAAEYGRVEMIKVATQLTDESGNSKGWAIALIPTEINWKLFEDRLGAGIYNDKRWSVYAASYDRVLLEFRPYQQLVEEVVSVVPGGSCSVLDIGAGTGNCTRLLVDRGHRVTAIEKTMGMLDRFLSKGFDPERVKLIKASVEHLDFLAPDTFDAAVMVNVLYALDKPLECLRGIHRALKANGVLALSTTHRETRLDPLLNAIRARLTEIGKIDSLASDWDRVYKANKDLEAKLVKQHTREDVRAMVKLAGFEIIKEISSTYEGAVMMLHLRKVG